MTGFAVPYSFATQPGPIPLSQLDANFTALVNRAMQLIYVSDYGAMGDGTTDDTAAFNNAHTAAAAVKGAVFMPGTAAGYNLAGTVAIKASMFGEGPDTLVNTSSTTADVFQCGVNQVILANFAIGASVTRSAGYFINFNGTAGNNQDCRLSNILMTGWFSAVMLGGQGSTGIHLNGLFLETTIGSGNGITVSTTSTNGVDIVIADTLIAGASSGTQCSNGILVKNVGDLTLLRVSTVKTGNGLTVTPGANQTVQAVIVSDSYFDSGSGAGIVTNPAATGTVQLLKVCNTWTCTNANGVVLNPSNTGATQRVELINVTASNNAAGQGILSQGGGTVSNLSIIGGSMSANTNGIYIGANTSGVTVQGVTSGPCGQFAGNSTNGMVIESGADNFAIIGNNLLGNTSAAINDGTTPAKTRVIRDNLGFITENGGTGAISSGSTSTTIAHGLSRTPTAKNINVTPTATTTSAPGLIWVDTITSTQFNVNCASNPGVSTLAFGWQAVIT